MPNHEHSEFTPPHDTGKAQLELELTGDWDDELRREAASRNRESSDEDPMSFKAGLRYLMEHQRTLADAAIHGEDDEDKLLLQDTAAQLDRDIKGAFEGDIMALRNLLVEIESSLEVRARTTQQDGGDSEIEREEIHRLRQVRDAVFERYEGVLAEQPSVADGAEHFLRKMESAQVTPEAVPQEALIPEISQEEAIKQLSQALSAATSVLRIPDVPLWFRRTLGNPQQLPPAVNVRISQGLHQLYRQFALKAGNRSEYANAIQTLFQQIKDEL